MKFYKQTDLIEFKKRIALHIRNIEKEILKAKEQKDTITSKKAEFLNSLEYRKVLVEDQRIIKKAISRKNYLLRINNIIYKREVLVKEIELLTELNKKKDKTPIFYTSLKKYFNIESRVSSLKAKLQKLEKVQNRINTGIFSYSLLTLKTL